MARIPSTAPPEVQDAFRELWDSIDRVTALNTDYKGVVLSNVGSPQQPFDAATKAYVDDLMKERVN